MWREKDAAAAEAKRVEDEKAEAAERERKAYSKAEKANSAAEIVLLKSAAEVDNALEVAGEAGGKQELVLREQIDARQARKEEFAYPFAVVKGLPKGAPSGVKEKVRHLKALVIMMIEHDNLQGRNLVSPPVPAAAEGPQIARAVPELPPGLRAPQLDHLDADIAAKQSAMKLVDDPKQDLHGRRPRRQRAKGQEEAQGHTALRDTRNCVQQRTRKVCRDVRRDR